MDISNFFLTVTEWVVECVQFAFNSPLFKLGTVTITIGGLWLSILLMSLTVKLIQALVRRRSNYDR